LHFGKTSTAGVSLGDNPVLGWQRKMRKVFFIVIALLLIWILVQIGKYEIAGNNDSMKGTYEPGTSVIYDRLFDWHDGIVPFFGIQNRGILHGNVIVFLKKDMEITNPETGETKKGDYYGISRVAGLPGETVLYKPGIVVIIEKHGEETKEKEYPTAHGHSITESEEIPPDCFFVLNDNLGSDIQDSRHFGCVTGEEIRGKVIVVLKLW